MYHLQYHDISCPSSTHDINFELCVCYYALTSPHIHFSPHTQIHTRHKRHDSCSVKILSHAPHARLHSTRESHSSRVPAAAPFACPPARSQSDVMFHLTLRGLTRQRDRIPTRPVAVPRSNLLAPACACSTSVNITPLQRPVVHPRFPFRENL